MPKARLQGNWMRDGGRQRERATKRATERERETERERVQCCVMWWCCRVGLALGHVSLVINMRCGATWQKANAKAISFRTQTLQGVHFTCPPTTTQSELHLAREWVGESERQREIEKKRERERQRAVGWQYTLLTGTQWKALEMWKYHSSHADVTWVNAN